MISQAFLVCKPFQNVSPGSSMSYHWPHSRAQWGFSTFLPLHLTSGAQARGSPLLAAPFCVPDSILDNSEFFALTVDVRVYYDAQTLEWSHCKSMPSRMCRFVQLLTAKWWASFSYLHFRNPRTLKAFEILLRNIPKTQHFFGKFCLQKVLR